MYLILEAAEAGPPPLPMRLQWVMVMAVSSTVRCGCTLWVRQSAAYVTSTHAWRSAIICQKFDGSYCGRSRLARSGDLSMMTDMYLDA